MPTGGKGNVTAKSACFLLPTSKSWTENTCSPTHGRQHQDKRRTSWATANHDDTCCHDDITRCHGNSRIAMATSLDIVVASHLVVTSCVAMVMLLDAVVTSQFTCCGVSVTCCHGHVLPWWVVTSRVKLFVEKVYCFLANVFILHTQQKIYIF